MSWPETYPMAGAMDDAHMHLLGNGELYRLWIAMIGVALGVTFSIASMGILLCAAGLVWESLHAPTAFTSVPHTLPGAAAEWFGFPLLLAWLVVLSLCLLAWRFHKHVSPRQTPYGR